MNYERYLKDRCVIQNRTIDPSGMVDDETWTAQAQPSKCRAITTITKRRTSPEGSEKVQYGTFVFLTLILPKQTNIAIHDRVELNGKVFDVIAVVAAGRTSTHHLVAQCDARA